MLKLPRVKSSKVIKALKRAGFYVDHITGSHYILYKNNKLPPVSVPRHSKDLKLGTLRNILRQAKMSVKDFIEYL